MRHQLSFFTALLLVGCAVQSQPQGGPRDEAPPTIVAQSPAMGTLNWSGNTAEVTFDEYIQAKNLRTAITTTPALEGIEAKIKGKSLSIEWDTQELLPNTTYRVALGDAVGDLNENNLYQNLELVWSTGSYIDSLSLHGSTIPEKKVPFDKLKIWLVPSGVDTVTTAIFSTVPGKSGEFKFSYLPHGTFDVLVFEDLNFNNRWEPESEPFGIRKNHNTELDSLPVNVPFYNGFFELPEDPSTSLMDSIAVILDTAKAENTGHLTLLIPPVDQTTFGWLIHESGYQKKFIFTTYRQNDTSYLDLGNQLPGKYVFRGFMDSNSDSTWTPASWYEDRESEFILTDQNFELKANWDLEQTLILK